MKRVVIVVPIYKESMSLAERCSWQQLHRVLGHYPIVLIAPEKIRGSVWEKKNRILFFSDDFFKSSYTYGTLLTEPSFYQKFQEYEYMLIYQLDAFVFTDQLEYFCSLGYDYIGAPMPFSQWTDVHGRIGNGGFSLRKIAACQEVCSQREIIIKNTDCKRIFLQVEDKFFGYCGSAPQIKFRVPSVRVALRFAIEFNAAHAWEKLSLKNLPFGCHAWSKPRYFPLWRHLMEPFSGDLSAVAEEIAAKGIEDYREIVWSSIRLYLWNKVMNSKNYEKVRNCLSSYLPLDKEFILWGNGEMGARGMNWMNKLQAKATYVFDRNAQPGERKAGMPVLQPDPSLLADRGRAVLITTTKYADDIAKELEQAGLRHEQDYFTLTDLEQHLLDAWYPCQRRRTERQGVVIWGAGEMGKRALASLGADNVAAILDSNPTKQGQSIEGIPIIPPSQYVVRLAGRTLVLAIFKNDTAKAWLEERSLPYIMYDEDEPWEFHKKDCSFQDFPWQKLLNEPTIGIWGWNFFALRMQCFLKQNQIEARLLPLIRRGGSAPGVVLSASRNFAGAAVAFPEAKVEDWWHPAYHLSRLQNSRIRRFKGLHQDERIFLVANGPSLCLQDLDRLQRHGEISFGVNMVYKAFDRTIWRPTYYVMEDMQAIEEYGAEALRTVPGVKFISDSNAAFWKKRHEIRDVYRYHVVEGGSVAELMQISGDIRFGTYARSSVMCTCLQIAMYMGASEIYILGMDCSYTGSTKSEGNHFIADYYNSDDTTHEVFHNTIDVFVAMQALRHYAENHGIVVRNATRGGQLEVFERVSFDSLF